jgi:Stage II sporulation protein E (SpoIIE)/ANTAR domain
MMPPAAARRIIARITVGGIGRVRRLPATTAAGEGRVSVKASDSGERAKLTGLVGWQRGELDRLRSEGAARSVTDVATGMLMERLGCSAAEARQQLDRLSSESGINTADLAAEITGQHLLTAFEPAPRRTNPARATAEAAPDGARLAAALLEEALSAEGAASVAIWLMEPDGGLELAGEVGLGPREASRWRRIPPDMAFPALRAVREDTEIWWPRGRPPHDDSPLAGRGADCARAVLPLRSGGVSFGALEICWPTALSAFSAPIRRQIAALADTCAQALSTGLPHTAPSVGYAAAWVFGLLDGLHESALFARAVRGDHGMVTGLVVDWVSRGFRDPAGRPAAGITGHQLLELYPETATSGGLFDRAIHVLASGEPQHFPGMALTGGASGGLLLEVRIARLFDGVVIAWRDPAEAERLTTQLQQAQWLGRIGSWEENLITGEACWTEPTFALFGQPPGLPVRLADLHDRVPAQDIPAVQAFQDRLLRQREAAAAVFRVVRADDGSVRQLRAFAEPVTGPAGDLLAVRGAYQDVSPQFHTQAAFEVAREQLADTEERAREEHRLAVRLQQAITPQASQLAEAAGLDVAARYRPAGPEHLVSGDWYDAVLLPTNEVLLAVGDVAGHGIEAVTGMVALRNSLRGLAITGAGPGTLLGWLNSAACYLADDLYGTAICGIYDPGNRTLRWARAGHLPPVVVHRETARTLTLPEGIMLGTDPDASYEEATIKLRLGDALLMFTDGLIERRDQSIDDALHALKHLASRPVHDIGTFADHLLARSASDTGDDACLIAISIH